MELELDIVSIKNVQLGERTSIGKDISYIN